jgi:hypothetical protein
MPSRLAKGVFIALLATIPPENVFDEYCLRVAMSALGRWRRSSASNPATG